MSFKDEVNANIPNSDEMKKNVILLIEKDILAISAIIRQRILALAKKHISQQNLVYEGILFTKRNALMKIETHHENSNGLFCQKSKEENIYSLNKYAHIFYSGLQKELKKDDISISKWKLISPFYNDDIIDYYLIDRYLGSLGHPYTNYTSYMGKCLFLLDNYCSDHVDITQGPFPFDSTYRYIYTSKHSNILDTDSSSSYSYYKGHTFSPGFPPHACIFIKFTND